MILYTMMPTELIFPSEPDAFSKQQLVQYQGIPLMVEKTDSHYAHVVRVLSSDPQHFLNEQIYPGMKISYAELDGLSANS